MEERKIFLDSFRFHQFLVETMHFSSTNNKGEKKSRSDQSTNESKENNEIIILRSREIQNVPLISLKVFSSANKLSKMKTSKTYIKKLI
ncbi:CLUMA_CG015640, isoform A [Clunio marinus]|uniref:CLUMA_CG015640, isoform A n=1 Tax=Clunio marinus TaxID=568069 RepID=A0A1J1IQP4_9DIPT|nr:CLUMA_CG015640, isoform A [Clunio marinus]